MLNTPKLRVQTGLCLAMAAVAIYTLSAAWLIAADPKPAKETKAAKKTEKQKLGGAELYALHCNRCHPERYPTEWKAAQWKTIMLHMRIRANLPASQAKAILKYLQEEAGN